MFATSEDGVASASTFREELDTSIYGNDDSDIGNLGGAQRRLPGAA